jgi:hypothetical protein
MTCSGNKDQTLTTHASTIHFDTVEYSLGSIYLENNIITVHQDMIVKIVLESQITQLQDHSTTIIWAKKNNQENLDEFISIPNSAVRLCSKDREDTTVLSLIITTVLYA